MPLWKNRMAQFISSVLLAATALSGASVRADWDILGFAARGPVRGVTQRDDGRWLGARLDGSSVSVVISGSGASEWSRLATVTSNDALAFGDAMILAVPGARTVFCSFRTHAGGLWRVQVYRSDNGGVSWAYDSTVAGPSRRFVGAPWLFLTANGDLQCYFDSEPLAAENRRPGFQWIAMKSRRGINGPWTKYNLVTVSRESDPNVLTRDGMPTVISLGGNRLLCVTEGVLPGHGNANVVRAIESLDGGATWDFSGRRVLYQCHIDPGTDRRYNAYAPFAFRADDGAVWVAFCTDEDYPGPPDASHAPVHQRHSHIKAIRSHTPWRDWSAPETIWSGNFHNYIPGLFQRGPGHLEGSVHLFDGRDALLFQPPGDSGR